MTNEGPLMSMAAALKPGGKAKPTSTSIQHHPDGSHTVTHNMSDGSTHPNSGAVANLDGVHDKIQEGLE